MLLLHVDLLFCVVFSISYAITVPIHNVENNNFESDFRCLTKNMRKQRTRSQLLYLLLPEARHGDFISLDFLPGCLSSRETAVTIVLFYSPALDKTLCF